MNVLMLLSHIRYLEQLTNNQSYVGLGVHEQGLPEVHHFVNTGSFYYVVSGTLSYNHCRKTNLFANYHFLFLFLFTKDPNFL